MQHCWLLLSEVENTKSVREGWSPIEKMLEEPGGDEKLKTNNTKGQKGSKVQQIKK